MVSCSTPKPGQKQVDAWVAHHPALWHGSADYDSLRILIKPDVIRDTFELSCRMVQQDIVEYRDTSQGDGKFQYEYWQSQIDSVNSVRPKVQVGWQCVLREEREQLTLYLGLTYEVDSAYDWSILGGRKIFP